MLATRDTPLQYNAAGSPLYRLLDVFKSKLCGQPPGDLPGASTGHFMVQKSYGSQVYICSSAAGILRATHS